MKLAHHRCNADPIGYDAALQGARRFHVAVAGAIVDGESLEGGSGMRYDWEMRRARRREGEGQGRRGFDSPYDSTFHGYSLGYGGGALRSRGSYEAGQVRSGLNPRDEFEFRWGDGYVGGRGYGGTNFDLTHGYRVGGIPRYYRPRVERPAATSSSFSSPAARGGYAWGEEAQVLTELYGPARYGYGPYFERLRRRRRSDEEIKADVEDALFYDTWVDADRITVEVEDGIVTLRGTLPNFDEVRFATDDAWDVDGVRGVRSEFEVGIVEPERGGEGAAEGEGGAEGEEEGGRSRRGARQTARAEGRGATASKKGKGSRSGRSASAREKADEEKG